MTLDEITGLVAACAQAQLDLTDLWHEREPAADYDPIALDEAGQGGAPSLPAVAAAEHLANFRLWHVEDEARRRDVGPEVIADCKRRIDGLNQRRNDLIERVDAALIAAMQDVLPANAPARHNTESAGMALDRLSILALKVFHMKEQTERLDAGEEHRRACVAKLAVLREQRTDLLAALTDLLADYAAGRKRPKVYFQFKMYNDPALNPALYGKGAKA
ncbi:Protein of unknown function DUF4254 [Desulfovibrio sp. X2]|uniref:DUF4254 domain-containing protein n=1 Tax=Desulfovibrio sp. X2 TaxID=941449 RepID=UPI0003588E87|nr:DUF4254 domain-containing protein [Desulfovibrio sp. X2]EPR41718.1 Protein of unknown function DUF4254 [Desulfovibrio sp. X2]